MGSDPQGSFKTHANYLRALAYLAQGGPALFGFDYKDLAGRVETSGVLASSPDITGVDLDQVKRSLSNAWGTEYLMDVAASVIADDELVALSNNWGVVQGYYAGYHAVQALAVSKKFLRPDSHPKTQNHYHDLWTNRPIQLAPWTLGAGNGAYRNLPSGHTADETLHPWSSCNRTTCWDLACKALRTTREDAVTEALARKREAKKRLRRQAWHKEERERLAKGRKPRKSGPPNALPRLTKKEKTDVSAGVREATLLDYLYRLRIKTNYVDSDMFTDGPEDGAESWQVRSDVGLITAGTMLVHELTIGSGLGFDRLVGWAEEWVKRNLPAGASSGLAGRLPAISDFV